MEVDPAAMEGGKLVGHAFVAGPVENYCYYFHSGTDGVAGFFCCAPKNGHAQPMLRITDHDYQGNGDWCDFRRNNLQCGFAKHLHAGSVRTSLERAYERIKELEAQLHESEEERIRAKEEAGNTCLRLQRAYRGECAKTAQLLIANAELEAELAMDTLAFELGLSAGRAAADELERVRYDRDVLRDRLDALTSTARGILKRIEGVVEELSPHAICGRGDASGPHDADCACRGTAQQPACAAAGCGFCDVC